MHCCKFVTVFILLSRSSFLLTYLMDMWLDHIDGGRSVELTARKGSFRTGGVDRGLRHSIVCVSMLNQVVLWADS